MGIADYVTARLNVPTIGIGAGRGCSGQVQVLHDVLGLYDKLQPKFSRQYVDDGSAIVSALESYVADVGTAAFPAQTESFTIADKQYDDFIGGQIAQQRESNDTAKREATQLETQIAGLLLQQQEVALANTQALMQVQ